MSVILKYIIGFFLYVLLQVALQDHLTLFNIATPFVFLIFLFTLPFDLPVALVYILAFFTGLFVDLFSDHAVSGIHAFSCVLAVSFRGGLAKMISTTNYRSLGEISFANQTPIWYVSYLLPLILIHHFAYFFLEAFSFQLFFFTLLKVISSAIYTFLIGYMLCFLFYSK